jgi:hypothetical protein
MNIGANLIFNIIGIVAAVLLFASGHCLFGLGNQAFAYGGYGDYQFYGGYGDPPFDYGSSPYDYCTYADYKSNVPYGDCFGY